MGLRVLVCGSRDWTDKAAIEKELRLLPAGSVVIHGDCRGADRIAGQIAQSLGLEVEAFPADWETHGKAAGPLRNRQMLAEGRPDTVLAFHEHLEASRGTADMVKKARAARIQVKVVKS